MPRTRFRQRPIPPITITRDQPPEPANAPWSTPPPPLATGARILVYRVGPCALCGGATAAGDRVADLADGRGTAHTACIARAQ